MEMKLTTQKPARRKPGPQPFAPGALGAIHTEVSASTVLALRRRALIPDSQGCLAGTMAGLLSHILEVFLTQQPWQDPAFAWPAQASPGSGEKPRTLMIRLPVSLEQQARKSQASLNISMKTFALGAIEHYFKTSQPGP